MVSRGRGIAAPFDFRGLGAYGGGERVGVIAQRRSRLISRRKIAQGSFTGRVRRTTSRLRHPLDSLALAPRQDALPRRWLVAALN